MAGLMGRLEQENMTHIGWYKTDDCSGNWTEEKNEDRSIMK
jgi:hypothetical protein